MQALRSLFIVFFLATLFAALPGTSQAQTDPTVCTALVKKALQELQNSCHDIGQGNVCYGHDSVEATYIDSQQSPAFAHPADQIKLNLLKTLHTSAAEASSQKLGIAALNFGAYPPGAATNTMALMLGDISLNLASRATAHQPNFTPAQSFSIHPPAGEPLCDDAQPLFAVRSPEKTTVPLTINGSDVQLNGLVTFHWESVNSLSATAHRGSLEIVGGPKAIGGQTLVAVVDNDGTIVLWSDGRPAKETEMKGLSSFSDLTGSLAAFASGCSQSTMHVVASGENLYRIAVEYDTTVDAIVAANGIANPNLISVGQSLIIPPCGQGNQVASAAQPVSSNQSSQTVSSTPQPTSSGQQTNQVANTPQPVVANSGTKCSAVYVVGPGDTMQSIASKFGGNIGSIMSANGIPDISSIFAGQQIVIPC